MSSNRKARSPEPPRAKATAEDVAAYLQVGVETLYKWRYARTGPPGVRVGKYLRYDWAEVEAWWVKRQAEQAA